MAITTQQADAARELFAEVWRGLESTNGRDNLRFPDEIFWLNGAPGAGKGTHTDSILRHLGYTSPPLVTSDLLKSEEARRRIDAGLLVGDREVAGLLLNRLLAPELRHGVIVDGFPRTAAQTDFLKLLDAKLTELHTAAPDVFPKPRFHLLVLLVDEELSVSRQMKRGNETRQAGGEVRKTDLDPELARKRYRIFVKETLEPLQALCDVFPHHIIHTAGTIEEVDRRIVEELR